MAKDTKSKTTKTKAKAEQKAVVKTNTPLQAKDAMPIAVKRETQHLSLDLSAETLLMEDVGVSRLSRVSIAVLGVVILGFFAFASFAQIEEAAKASGMITPEGKSQVVQHLEGGVVSEILVQDGERVREGQVIAMLKSNVAEAQLYELQQQEASLMLQEERLRAYVENRDPNFDNIPEDFQALAADQALGFATQSESRLRKVAIAEAEIAQSRAGLNRTRGELNIAKQQVALLDEDIANKQELLNKGFFPKSRMTALKGQRNDAKAEVLRLDGEIARLTANITGNENRLAETGSVLKEKALADLQTVGTQLRGAREKLASALDKGERLDITAPTTGLIKGLTVNTIGQVIAPGATLAEIVPTTRKLLVEARVPVGAIGRVHQGQAVSVKVTAYNVAQYGAIEGEITTLSPDSFVDDKTGEAYYRARIALAKTFAGEDEIRNPLLPGMAVQADINTGTKSLIAYLFKPVHAVVTNSFKES